MSTLVWCQRSSGSGLLAPGVATTFGGWHPDFARLVRRCAHPGFAAHPDFARLVHRCAPPARLVCRRLVRLCAAASPRHSRVSWFVPLLGNSCVSHSFLCVAQHLLPGPKLAVGLPILIRWCPRLIMTGQWAWALNRQCMPPSGGVDCRCGQPVAYGRASFGAPWQQHAWVPPWVPQWIPLTGLRRYEMFNFYTCGLILSLLMEVAGLAFG